MKINNLGIWMAVCLLTFPTVLLIGQSEVPQAVQTTFNEMFPSVEYVEWDDDGGEEFFAYFTFQDREVEANFLANEFLTTV